MSLAHSSLPLGSTTLRPARFALALALLLAVGAAPLRSARAAAPVEIVPDQIYAGGTTLTSSAVGVTFNVPEGWRAGLPSGAEALILEREAGQAMVLVAANRTTEAEVLAELQATQELGGGARLQPMAAPQRDEQGVWSVRYAVIGGLEPSEGAGYARIGPEGVGVLFFALDVGEAGHGRRIAVRLARDVRFSKPAADRAPTPASGGGQAAWQDYMRGRYIARFYSGSGYHEKEELWLCSDGRFRRSSDGGGFGGGASGAFAGGGDGRWSASGQQPGAGTLRLEYADGVATYSLSLQNEKLFLDGTQWLRGDNELCP